MPIWWGMGHEQPEMVLENEVKVGPNGKVEVLIDTTMAKELHPNQDHKYTIIAEVTDQSRRTIVGQGDVLVSRKPFQVYTWLDKGQFRTDDVIKAHFKAQTLDKKPVEGKGKLTLFAISYNDKAEPIEKAVETWDLDTNVEGFAMQQIKAAKPGQYRLSYQLTSLAPRGRGVGGEGDDAKKNTIEGGQVFLVIGQGFDSTGFRFNDLELTADRKEYNPGDKVKLAINTNRADSTVLLFARPTNGVYLAPKLIKLKGKSIEEELTVGMRDMPNFFVEVMTIANGQVFTETRELIVPPEKRIVNVEVLPGQKEYKPGQKATVKLKLTDNEGNPFTGSTVVSVYDKSVEYISGGSNVPEIKEFFWKWRRHHAPQTQSSITYWSGNLLKHNEIGMSNLGVFGATVVEEFTKLEAQNGARREGEPLDMAAAAAPMAPGMGGFGGGRGLADVDGARMQFAPVFISPNMKWAADERQKFRKAADRDPGDPSNGPEPTVRKNFADTAYWTANLTADKDGIAEFSFNAPDQLTAWKIRVWSMGHGTRVGQGEAEVVTKKDLIVRLQAPRFFVQKDEVVLSANVHNYHKTAKAVRVSPRNGWRHAGDHDPPVAPWQRRAERIGARDQDPRRRRAARRLACESCQRRRGGHPHEGRFRR